MDNFQKVGSDQGKRGGVGLFAFVFLIFALFVEVDSVCYSDGANWSTTPVDGWTNVSKEYNQILWGLAISTFFASVIPLCGTINLGFFIWMIIAIFSSAGKVCGEHVLSSRHTLFLVNFWVSISIIALVCCIVCVAIATHR